MAKKINTVNTPIPTVYMNILSDFGFKKVFSDKELLIHFLNDILPDAKIKDIQYRQNEAVEWENRKAVFDLLCQNEDNEYFLVEVQNARQLFFSDRALFYASCIIRNQAPQGNWNYELKAVYIISLLNFVLAEFEKTKEKQIFEYVSLMNERTKKRFSDKLRFVYVQLKNFNKAIEELDSNVDYWLYFLKNLQILEKKPLEVQGRIFERLFHIAQINKLNKEEMKTYNKSILEYNDVMSAVQYAEQCGEKRGEKRMAILLGKKLTEKGMSVIEISELTGISVDELNENR
jgi:predicted transposase/invertase (TIGR01784 family)